MEIPKGMDALVGMRVQPGYPSSEYQLKLTRWYEPTSCSKPCGVKETEMAKLLVHRIPVAVYSLRVAQHYSWRHFTVEVDVWRISCLFSMTSIMNGILMQSALVYAD
ncbi:hypothetical protein HAX54_031427 [Datura stramonium]|uniref:Uncharacterized protein n=1 Tax=Datura stramonium TaxID=4076 RepID=A0ABS8VBN2_DATST|nr:hypothetical protein [Datura stramonium]